MAESFMLVCVHPFANYKKGQHVTDPDEIEAIQRDEDKKQRFVRAVNRQQDQE